MKKAITVLYLCFALFTLGDAQSKDLIIIKQRVVTELLKVKPNDSQVEAILAKMKEDGSFSDINYTDLSRTASFPHGRHTSDLAYLARAFKTPSSAFHQSEKVKNAIVRGLNFWVKNDFVGDNWHDNQITTPTNLMNLILAIGDDLPKDLIEKAQPMIGRANMSASGARPSGDRIVIAGILAKNLLFLGKDMAFDTIIHIIEGEMKFSTGERCIQHDYSFHHRPDRVNNTDSYGYGKFANAYGEWSSYVAGTKYQFSKENINLLVDYYLDGIYKQQVYGIYDDVGVANRSISIKKPPLQPKGTLEIERLLVSTDYRKKELEDIIKLRKGEARPTSSFAKFFWQTEHFVFQRPNFYTSVRMFSTRNRNMEEPYNGPGKTTHHRADGTNYLMLKGDEYHNIWAVYDWQKISGTTIMQKPSLPPPTDIQKDGLTNFVGAVTDGLYGAVAFDFKSPHDMLEAKKSWFFFDEEYVCLGAGIKPKKSLPIVTTINQVLLRSEVIVMQDGQKKVLSKGNRIAENVKWVHQDKIGYLFPEPTTINISNQSETGRWSDITDQKNISTELVSEDVFKLWFNHGDKINETDIHGKRKMEKYPEYQYIVVPNVSEQKLAETSVNNRNIEILSNTADLQGVKHGTLGIVQLAFYKAGEVEIAKGQKIKMDSQGMVMLKMAGDKVKQLTVADPSRCLGRILITLPGAYTSKSDKFICLPNVKNNTTTVIVDLPQGVYLGKSVMLSF
ncbi:MAG: polysaccharide lyase family 8 super-sandwich domain-containing protein [Haliscomenobacter sp.]|uniref:polysaccharide lyase family 8 super-sandwich domain-containing protein n=1 Tax=Haliscomenobacter sp. TaxID=2717303 RepID=UPI0029AC8274|nr:polysaccharide lyase family 8 super-sandwich domain-containing protein [Haliscomenobacter sp.]MDX2070688.1 polysaccharide lyase family 8 super-sandwich domain-containing protein [Haliscomenobacter sp.]